MSRGALAVVAACLCLEPALAQDYPARAIDLYIGSAPSGSTDGLGRALARSLSEVLEQPVVVHNTPGAGGAVMATLLKGSTPDGYSLGMTISHAYSGNPVVMPEATQYSVDDFTHLASVSKGQCALVTESTQPYESLEDLVDAARRGEAPIYAAQSPLTRLVAEYIARAADVDFRIITVQGGGEIMQTILGRHADFGFSGGPHVDFVEAGKMRVLASVEASRLITSPEVPTLMELGYDIASCSMFVVSAPPGLPEDIEQILAVALEQAIASPEMKTSIRNLQYPEHYLGPDEVTRALEQESEMLRRALERIDAATTDAPGLSPRFMPYVAGGLGGGALALIFVGWSRRAGHEPAAASLSKESWIFVASASAIFIAAFVLMDTLGYLPGAAAIVAGFMALGRANFKVLLGASIAFPVVLWWLFSKVLGFPLP